MSTTIAINGFGRIGRNVARALYENNQQDQLKLDLQQNTPMVRDEIINSLININFLNHDIWEMNRW